MSTKVDLNFNLDQKNVIEFLARVKLLDQILTTVIVGGVDNMDDLAKYLLDQKSQLTDEFMATISADEDGKYPWETPNKLCSWCGKYYADAEKHSGDHDYGGR